MEDAKHHLILVGIVALCTAAAARPQEFKPSRLITSEEPGFFGASDAIRPGFRRDGRSFDSGVVPSQLIEEFKGELITGRPFLGSFDSSEDDTHVVRGSISIASPQGVKQEIIKYKETPGLSALVINGKSNSKKNTRVGRVIYGSPKSEGPVPPKELYIITAARREKEAAATKRHAKADKSFRKSTLE